ncbi:MAG: acylphosphatase [Gemmatimonadales bacterium]|nr:acylphosphatase [Gemmatimonadales bacterium]
MRFLATGRVQGVGYRNFVVRVARRLGLAGWTRNLPDGTVEVVTAGDAGELAQLEEELHRGPPFARVAGVTRGPAPAGPLPTPFEMRR